MPYFAWIQASSTCASSVTPRSVYRTRTFGSRSGTRRDIKLRKPYAALTSVPSSARISGTAWYARYARLAASTKSVLVAMVPLPEDPSMMYSQQDPHPCRVCADPLGGREPQVRSNLPQQETAPHRHHTHLPATARE